MHKPLLAQGKIVTLFWVLVFYGKDGLFWRKNAFIKTPGTITVSIGKPIETADLKTDALNQQVEDWIEAEQLKLWCNKA